MRPSRALALTSLLVLSACTDGGGLGRPSLARAPANVFLTLHIDLDAVRGAGAFQRLIAAEEAREGWEEMQEGFARQMGFEMARLRGLTLMGFMGLDDRPAVLMHLLCDDDAALEAVGRLEEVGRGEYGGGTLDVEIPADDVYWLRLDCYDPENYDREPFDGTLSGTGELAERFLAAPREGDLIGPVEATRGELLIVTPDSVQHVNLELVHRPSAVSVGELEVFPFERDGLVCSLPEGGLLFGDDLFRSWDVEDLEAVRRAAMTRALTPGPADDPLRAAFDALPWPRTAIAAFRWPALPRELREDLVANLGEILPREQAAALRELEVVTLDATWAEGTHARLELRCEDEEGAEEVEDLVADLLDLAEAVRELPRTAEDVLEAIEVTRAGELVRVEATVAAEELDAIFDALGRMIR